MNVCRGRHEACRGHCWPTTVSITPIGWRYQLIKAKSHYAIQVADLVADPVFDELFVWVCDQLATFLGRKQVADRFELSRHIEIARTWSQIGSQLAFDQLSTGLRHAHAGLRPCRRPATG